MGHYIVFIETEKGELLNLQPASPVEGYVKMFIGGEEGEFLTSEVVDRNQAYEAGMYYLKNEMPIPDLNWAEG